MVNNSRGWGKRRKESVADTIVLVCRTRERQTIPTTMLFSTPQHRQWSVGRSSLRLHVHLARLLQIVNTSALVCNHIFSLWISAVGSRTGKWDHFWQIVLRAQCLLFSVLFTSSHLSGNASRRRQVQSKIGGLIIFTELLTKMWLQASCFLEHS